MANVNIKFNGKEFLLSCDDGQEEHLEELLTHINEKFSNLKNDLGNIGENKLLLITTIELIDEYFDLKRKITAQKAKLDIISNRFKEIKSLAIKYKEDKTIFAYAHISFNINGIQGDLVHAHTHLPKIKGKSALKFMHFPCAKDSSLQSWIVVYKVGDRDTYKNEFNLRILNQEGKESIFYFNFSKQDSIKAINLNELVS